MAHAVDFLGGRQRDGCQYITSLTVNRTGPVIANEFYSELQPAVRLRYLNVRLPSMVSMPLTEHIDTHFRSLRLYLCPPNAGLEEALRRLDTVWFDIGSSQRSVLDEDGDKPVKMTTPEINALCRARVRIHLRSHFRSKAVRRLKAREQSEDSLSSSSEDETQLVTRQEKSKINKGGTTRERAQSIIVIDD